MATSLGFDGTLTIAIQVKDRKKSIQWYEKVVGSKLLYDVAEIGWCEVSLPIKGDGVSLGLSEVETPKTDGTVPTFGVHDLDATRKRMEAADVRFDGKTREYPGMVKLASFFDPDGNPWMLAQTLQK